MPRYDDPISQPKLLKWNRPDEPGLEEPLFSPVDLLGAGGGLLWNKLTRIGAKGLGGMIERQTPLTDIEKIANLRSAARRAQATWSEKPMAENYKRVVDAIDRMKRQLGE